MKRLICFLLTLVLIGAAGLPVSADDAPALRLAPSAQTVCPGQTFTVTMTLSAPLNDVGALEIHLLYDTDALTFRGCTAGDANPALQPIRPTDERAFTGVLFVYDYGADAGAVSRISAGTLLTAEFAVKSDAERGAAAFRLSCVTAQDTAFAPVALDADAAPEITICRPTVSIVHYVPETTIDYRTTLTLYAETAEPVDGGEVCWLVNGTQTVTGEKITLDSLRADVRVQAQYRLRGETVATSDEELVHVRAGFFARLAAFFRALFGLLPKVVQAV